MSEDMNRNQRKYDKLVTVANENGLGMYAARRLADLALPFPGDVTLSYGLESVNAKNMTQIMYLQIPFERQAELSVRGKGAYVIGEKIAKAFEEGFGLDDVIALEEHVA